MTFQRIDQHQAKALIADQGAVVVDIRDPASFEQGHISGALHLDNDSLQPFLTDTEQRRCAVDCNAETFTKWLQRWHRVLASRVHLIELSWVRIFGLALVH